MTDEIITSYSYEPDENGVWHGPFYINADGYMTHNPEEGIAQTDVEAPLGYVWCFTSSKWVDPRFSRGSGFEYEIQYIDGVETKKNFTKESPEYSFYLKEYLQVRPNDGVVAVISKKEGGKISAYLSLEGTDLLTEFQASERNWNTVASVSILPDSSTSLKLYDKDINNYSLPSLPSGAVLGVEDDPTGPVLGVACTWSNGVELADKEVYFYAPREQVETWAAQNSLALPPEDVDYWGVVFDSQSTVKHLKGLKWVPKEIGEVERCWINGTNIRSGYDKETVEAGDILSVTPERYLTGTIMNVGTNDYDLGSYGVCQIASVYYSGEASQYHRDLFSVPEDVISAPWYGMKYCPDHDCEWLKLADMDYSKYTLPSIPANAERAFGVATVYAKTQEQPPVHNVEGDGWRDCSFITRDHAAVRSWCTANNLQDPAPFLPDTTILFGVYSITHHATTGEIQKIKYYDYHSHQRFDMEVYLTAVLAGRAQGYTFDEPLLTEEVVTGARTRVSQFNQSVQG